MDIIMVLLSVFVLIGLGTIMNNTTEITKQNTKIIELLENIDSKNN